MSAKVDGINLKKLFKKEEKWENAEAEVEQISRIRTPD